MAKDRDDKVLDWNSARWSFGKPLPASRDGRCGMCDLDFDKGDRIIFLHYIDPDAEDQVNGSRNEFERVHVACAKDEYVRQTPVVQWDEAAPVAERQFNVVADVMGTRPQYTVVDKAGARFFRTTVMRKAQGVAEYLSGDVGDLTDE